MATRNREHVYLTRGPWSEAFTPVGGGGGSGEVPRQSRESHGGRLRRQYQESLRLGDERRSSVDVPLASRASGIYVALETFPDIEHVVASLNSSHKNNFVEVCSVKTQEDKSQIATVFVPDDRRESFLKKLDAYLDPSKDNRDTPRNANLVDRIQSIRLATLAELWSEPGAELPDSETVDWWEVWLRGGEISLEAARDAVRLLDLELGEGGLVFEGHVRAYERSVLAVHGAFGALSQSLDILSVLAEVRHAAREVPFFTDFLDPADQVDWVEDLEGRVEPADPQSPAVVVLDGGIQALHPLLRVHLDPTTDAQSARPGWTTADDSGHGSGMSGLAIYGDRLDDLLGGSGHFLARHGIESVKVLPPVGANAVSDYGLITVDAVAVMEAAGIPRRRVFALAITSDVTTEAAAIGGRYGQPTLWSTVIDALAVGRGLTTDDDGIAYLEARDPDAARLFVLSAGNVTNGWLPGSYVDACDATPVQDPAQSWNSLTVGAFTALEDVRPGTPPPMAKAGDLSPHSRTSVLFDYQWSAKPDIVMEGGNLILHPASGLADRADELEVLTVNGQPGAQALLTTFHGTSSAASLAAGMAASIWAEKPDLWPETVRALIVHSARWTETMLKGLPSDLPKGRVEAFVRRYGMGVPDLDRAIRSADNEVTLVAQDVIAPFEGVEGQYRSRIREWKIYDLPWPAEVLRDLGSTEVRLRVVLSYFIEPRPGRLGYSGRYQYASHGLRFDVRRPSESTDEFRARVNADVREQLGHSNAGHDSNWLIGPQRRVRGSLHSDIWTGTAAELADRGMIGVFPVGGWWKDANDAESSEVGVRYALVASIEAPESDVDLWTPIAVQLEVPIEIET